MKSLILILTLTASLTDLLGQSGLTDDMILNSLKSKFTLSEYDKVDNIMTFNKDTILLSGYLSDNKTYGTPKNVVFQTFDGGKNWKKNYFKGDAWIYNVYFQNDGKVWMGGSDEYVHYSNDYGTSWTVKPKPFNPVNRVLSIYMIDSLSGIAGGLHNGLAMTNDNWQTTTQIPSPLDQKKFTITKESSRDRIDKVEIIDSIILINQNDHIYYSKLNHIDWRSFNIPTRDFSVNHSKKTIELNSIRNKVYILDADLNLIETYSLPEEFRSFEPIENEKIDIESFLSSDIKLITIKAVKYDFDKLSGGCVPYAIYNENSEGFKIKKYKAFAAWKNILETYESYDRPSTNSFQFSEKDLADYFSYYVKLRTKRKEEKIWGGDFTYLLNIDNDLFLNPNKTIATLDQHLLDTVYRTCSKNPYLETETEPFIFINLVNNKSDTLRITSKNSKLFSLPWTIEYNGHSFQTYDTRVTEMLKSTLPIDFNYYDKLFAGELIYRLIEQRIINEMTYKKDN